MEVPDRIAQLLDAKYAADEAFADCFTVEIELRAGPKLNVFIDSDSGFSFEKCHKISRYLESYLDAEGWLGEKYVLEVSSPGLNRPLKFQRQYRNNIGRQLAVTLTDGSQRTGTLTAADHNQITLHETVREKEGKKNKDVDVETMIPYEQIQKAVVKPVLTLHPKKAKPKPSPKQSPPPGPSPDEEA